MNLFQLKNTFSNKKKRNKNQLKKIKVKNKKAQKGIKFNFKLLKKNF